MSARLQHTIAVVSWLAVFALISAIIGEVVHLSDAIGVAGPLTPPTTPKSRLSAASTTS